ncbi:hypothetical protein BGX28_004984 [Mortierella sp. GBA30]|nr:hypothetical protein BGX28_004984 [Mortierella sp. GBA30]
MDRANMSEEQARETVARMFQEMSRTLNAEGDYSESEEEYTDSDNEETVRQGSAQKLLENEASLEVQEDPFDPSKSAAERVEIAVARFRKNRKFSPTQSQILSVYLEYGGIRSGPKSFQGGGVKSGGVDDDGEPDYDAMNVGIDAVDLPEDGQEVDFTNVVTTFLSQHFLKYTGWVDMTYYRDTPVVVASLLNYFLVRSVLPEYEDDLRQALSVAMQAKVELPLIKMISMGIPGKYDRACSLMYGGEWYNFLEHSVDGGEEAAITTLGLDWPTARKILHSIVGQDIDLKSLTISSREFMDLEIIRVNLPDLSGSDGSGSESPMEETEVNSLSVAMVDRMLLGETSQASPARTEGVVDKDQQDDKEEEERIPIPVPVFAEVVLAELNPDLPREQQKPIEERRQFKVYFDSAVATKMLLGMRFTGVVYTLSNGISYLEQAAIYPTYYLEVDEIEGSADEWED